MSQFLILIYPFLQSKNTAGCKEQAKSCAMINVIFQNPYNATAKRLIYFIDAVRTYQHVCDLKERVQELYSYNLGQKLSVCLTWASYLIFKSLSSWNEKNKNRDMLTTLKYGCEG